MKIKINKFMEHGIATIAGTLSATLVDKVARSYEMVGAPLTGDSLALTFGVAMGTVFAARFTMDKMKLEQTNESLIQFVPSRKKRTGP